MADVKPWELLRSGDFDRGLRIMREECEAKPAARYRLRLGIGYMWAEMYDSAVAHFTDAANSPGNSEHDFAYAGVAEWHLGNTASAVQLWRHGFKAQYAVGSMVCSMTARLLVVATALERDLFPKQEADRYPFTPRNESVASRSAQSAHYFVLGLVERCEVEEQWVGNIDRGVKGLLPHRIWITDFYHAARRLNHAEVDVQGFPL